MIPDNEVAGAAGRPLPGNAASFASQQPGTSSPYYSGYPPPGAPYIAGTSPASSLLPFPSSSTVASYWASGPASSSSMQQQQQQQQLYNPWEQHEDYDAPISSFLADFFGPQNGCDDLSAIFSRPQPAPQLAVPPPEQPQVQVQPPTQTHPGKAIAASAPVEAVPRAEVNADGPASPITPPPPKPRRRGRPRKDAAASSPKRPPAAAPRRKASRQGRRQPAQTSAVRTAAPCVWEEASMAEEERVQPYSDPTAPGVRFQPKDEEMIGYLRLKYLGRKMPVDFFRDFNVYQARPETIPESCGESVDGCWYVFSPRNRKYKNGERPARGVGDKVGFWKSNNKEEDIKRDGGVNHGTVIGKHTELTFAIGHQPKGTLTSWKMKEYCIPEKQHMADGSNMLLDDWVLCKIFYNGGKEGEHLGGANEDADDADEDMHSPLPVSSEEEESVGKTDDATDGALPAGFEEEESAGKTDNATDGTQLASYEEEESVGNWIDQALSNYEENMRVEDYHVSDDNDPMFEDQKHVA